MPYHSASNGVRVLLRCWQKAKVRSGAVAADCFLDSYQFSKTSDLPFHKAMFAESRGRYDLSSVGFGLLFFFVRCVRFDYTHDRFAMLEEGTRVLCCRFPVHAKNDHGNKFGIPELGSLSLQIFFSNCSREANWELKILSQCEDWAITRLNLRAQRWKP